MTQQTMRALVAAVAASLWLACGPTNLPDDQVLTSPHFRYHARAETVLDPTIMDRLEAKRAEVNATFGIESGVVDYYLYRDGEDVLANSPCTRPCTQERRIFSMVPFQEHELVHALFGGMNDAAVVLQEGVAQYAACAQPKLAYSVDPASWPGVLGNRGQYDFGQRLTAWMMETGGAKPYLAFLGQTIVSDDPALFALQFQRAWGRRLSDVAVTIDDARYAGSRCPCAAAALPVDGSISRFVGTQEYRVLDVATESLLQLDNDGEHIVMPVSCTNGADEAGSTLPSAPSTRTFARVGAGKYAVTTTFTTKDVFSPSVASVSAALTPTSDWSCAGAPRIAVGEKDVTLWVTGARAAETTWFAIDLPKARRVEVITENTTVVTCATCSCEGGSGGGAGYGARFSLPAANGILIGLSSTDDRNRIAPSVAVRITDIL